MGDRRLTELLTLTMLRLHCREWVRGCRRCVDKGEIIYLYQLSYWRTRRTRRGVSHEWKCGRATWIWTYHPHCERGGKVEFFAMILI